MTEIICMFGLGTILILILTWMRYDRNVLSLQQGCIFVRYVTDHLLGRMLDHS